MFNSFNRDFVISSPWTADLSEVQGVDSDPWQYSFLLVLSGFNVFRHLDR